MKFRQINAFKCLNRLSLSELGKVQSKAIKSKIVQNQTSVMKKRRGYSLQIKWNQTKKKYQSILHGVRLCITDHGGIWTKVYKLFQLTVEDIIKG